MKAQKILFDAPGNAVLASGELGSPGAGEVAIEADMTLISAGTERMLLMKAPSYPIEPGYSMVGRVTGVGPGVSGLSVGDRVFANAGHASHVICDHRWVYPIPADVASEEAVFLSVAGMAIHAVRLADLRLGDPLLILGQGLIGLVATQVARMAGAAPITVVDVVEERLAVARRFGADRTFLAEDRDALAASLRTLPGGGPAATIELSAHSSTVDLAVELTRRQGRIITGSLVPGGHMVDVYGRAWLEGISIVGAYYNARPWQLDATETTSPYDWPVRLREGGRYEGSEVATGRGEMALFMRLLEFGRLRLALLLSETVSAEEAPALFGRLPRSSSLGHIIRWR